MIIKFFKNLIEDIQENNQEGTFFAVIFSISISLIFFGEMLMKYNSNFLNIGRGMVISGISISGIIMLYILIMFLIKFFNWLKKIWIRTKEDNDGN